jgi:hypothetical protein
MSLILRFASYAAAFGEACSSHDWSPIGKLFAEGAAYDSGGMPAPLGGRFDGRAAILAYFKFVVDGFDRRFASRAVGPLGGPREQGASVWFRASVVYTSPCAPELRFEFEEIVTFDAEGRIQRIEDRYDAETIRVVTDYVRANGKTLGLASA